MTRLPRIKLALLLLTASFLSCWIFLHLDSVYQRRKAERLFVDLRAFPYESADFAQVREFSVRYGGRTNISFQSTNPTCTRADCDFDVLIQPTITKLLLSRGRFLQIAAVGLGLRPWGISVSFTVRRGLLEDSRISIAQERFKPSTSYGEPIGIEYTVETYRTRTPYSDATFAGKEYVVTRPHITGPPEDVLVVSALTTADGHWKGAFDVHLGCLTTVLRGCDAFSQLAPAAWSRYQAEAKIGS